MRPRLPVNSATNATTSGTRVTPTIATDADARDDDGDASTDGAEARVSRCAVPTIGRAYARRPLKPRHDHAGRPRPVRPPAPRSLRPMAGTGIRVRRRRTTAVFVALVTAAASVAATTERPARAATWDPRLAPIAREVEHLRHLRFLHPIPARFLSDRAFRKEVTSDDHVGAAARARRRDAVSEAELRALGLVDGTFDLRTTVDDVQGSDVLAFYDSDRERIVVRGKHLDAEHRVTLAHELTHGLQDQHYDLTKLQDAADTGGADDALTALIEGDATRIEDAYYGQLGAK